MFSTCEDWISCLQIKWNENDFMKNSNEILFQYCKIQWTNENMLIF